MQLIQEPMKTIGFEITNDQAQRIFEGTAGVPMLIQDHCIRLLHLSHHGRKIDGSAIEEVERSPDYLNMVFKYYAYAQGWESRSIVHIAVLLKQISRRDIMQKFAEHGIALEQKHLETLLGFLVNFGVLEEFEAGHYRVLSRYLSLAIEARDPEALLDAEFRERKD
jgi:hypothetical protein